MKLNDEQKKLVTDNIALALWMAKKWKANIPECEFDELVSVSYLGLIKAALHYDKGRVKFATFATRCLVNEIFMMLRKVRKAKREVYLNDRIARDKAGNELTLSDILQEPGADQFMRDEMIQEVLDEALAYMRPKDKQVVEMIFFEKMEQHEVGKILSLSQSFISRLNVRGLTEAKKRFGKNADDMLRELYM